MFRRRLLLALSSTLALMLFGSNSPAEACWPDCCHPCWPCFRLCATLLNPSGYVNPDAPIPYRIAITNESCCHWCFNHSEYRFWLLNECGCVVPCGLSVCSDCQWVHVPPCVSVIDWSPPVLRLNKCAIEMGRRYTVVVCLRCRCSCFCILPQGEYGRTHAAASVFSGKVIVTLPPGAELRIDGQPTASHSGRQVFVTEVPIDRDCRYTLTAMLQRDGRVIRVERQVTVRPGKEAVVDLAATEAAVASK